MHTNPLLCIDNVVSLRAFVDFFSDREGGYHGVTYGWASRQSHAFGKEDEEQGVSACASYIMSKGNLKKHTHTEN